MKKRWMYIGLCLMALTACQKDVSSSGGEKVNKELIEAYWADAYKDEKNGFNTIADITNAFTYIDGVSVDKADDNAIFKDVKHLFLNKNAIRAVNLPEGYAFTFPAQKMSIDASLSKLRTKYFTDQSILTITTENQNPYGNTPRGWEIYLTEWINRFINDPGFLQANNLAYIQQPSVIENYRQIYELHSYDIEILDHENIEYPYYHIRVLRPMDDYINFHLFVMKSKIKNTNEIDMVMDSFTIISKMGVSKNIQQEYTLKIPSYWTEETKNYYQKLKNQNTVDWGVFSVSMPSDNDGNYNSEGERLLAEKERLETAFDYQYDILPTYTHMGWYNYEKPLYRPNFKMAKYIAGGNGFNNKPVLQYTYQFTYSNNTELNGYTPMFDVLRGKFDDFFASLARDVKSYEQPVLFRLNNEMNTDWTSYCGMVTLLDPDIFIMTWQKLYKIFEKEGVNNAIWIFNPIARSTPYSNWGDMLNFMPGEDYVQMLGLTSYEMGNDAENYRSFYDHYTELYQRNTPYFDQYPAIISEFAAGSGGEVMMNYDTNQYEATEPMRNKDLQAMWVQEMFTYFNAEDKSQYPFVKNIKAAIWFSTNDVVVLNDETKITNYLKLDDALIGTLAAFKEGLKNNH